MKPEIEYRPKAKHGAMGGKATGSVIRSERKRPPQKTADEAPGPRHNFDGQSAGLPVVINVSEGPPIKITLNASKKAIDALEAYKAEQRAKVLARVRKCRAKKKKG